MIYQVAVRALCEFTAKQGDLDLRFTPSPTAQEGIAGHMSVVARRGSGYVSELPLSGEYEGLLVRGRADGYNPDEKLLEEIKTHRGDISRIPENHRLLHWAQVKVYGALLCREYELEEVDLAVVYFNVLTHKETSFRETFNASALQAFFELHCQRFITWAKQEQAHRIERDDSLGHLRFPHATFRSGQRQLAEAVYRAARDGHSLMAQATTGIGKTIGTLFPQLKAFPEQKLDRLFFLTAKTPGRRLALDALETLRAQEPKIALRVLEHVARDKACEHPDKACHGDSCPLAKGFYDRLPAARKAALDSQWLNQSAVRDVALAHGICPYYLSQELCRWSDVVVGDYNYYFDMTALLYGLTQLNEWKVTLLVDEAHNLVERGRGMYSAELQQARFKTMRGLAPKALKSVLDRVNRHWNQLTRSRASVVMSRLFKRSRSRRGNVGRPRGRPLRRTSRMEQTRMRTMIVLTASLLTITTTSPAQQMPDGSANRAAMQRLSGMIGTWRGEAWMMIGDRRENTTMTETVEAKLEGTVLLIEGHGVVPVPGGAPRTVHHALAILSFDPRTRAYSLRSHVGSGFSGDFAVSVTDSTVEWSREVPGGRIRNIARIGNGTWHETGEFSRDGTSWMQMMEIRLRKE